MKIHSDGLFLDIIESHYFGSHISTKKLDSLFRHAFKESNYFANLEKLKNSMRLYKATNGLSPFPNADNFS